MSDSTVEEPDGDPTESDERPDDHFEDMDDGCGCAEVWDYLSERRGEGNDTTDAGESTGEESDG